MTENVPTKTKRLPLVVLAEAIASAINGDPHPYPQPWPHLYRVLEPAPGARLICQEDDRHVLTEVPIDHLAERIVAWTRLHGSALLFMTLRQAREAAEMWRSIAEPLDPSEVKSVRWSGEHGLAWQRLPWDMRGGSTPTWDKLLGRMSNSRAFCEWVGSLFFDQSSLHSYVWLYGIGGDGKGSLSRFLAKVFGRAFRSKQPPGNRHDKFWTYGLIGARLVVFPDCNDHTFVSGGLFKSLTGGDPVDVEAKGRMSFTTRLNAKFMVISQEKPSLSSERADMRRIIYCELGKTDDYDPAFEDRLWAEGGAFLYNCVQAYATACPDHRPIKADMEQITEWVSEVEEPFEEFFTKHFILAENGQVAPAYMQEALEDRWPRNRTQQVEFRRWLERTHNVRKTRPRIALAAGGRQNVYRGILISPKGQQVSHKGFYED